MRQRLRKAVAVIVSAALPLGVFPLSAFADSSPPPNAAPLPETPVSLSDARALFKKAGISDANIDAYLIPKDEGGLSTLGRLLYRPMKERYEAEPGHALQEEGRSLNDRLTGLTKKNHGQALPLTDATLQEMRAKLGAINGAYDPDDPEANYQRAAQIEAVITGGEAPADKGGAIVHQRPDGTSLLSDADGPAEIVGKDGKVQKNFKLQQQQRDWNRMQDRPAGAPMIPETGRYNRETIEFGYWQLKAGIDAQFDQMRLGRMRQLAQLLGEDTMLLPDMYDAATELRLENEARTKSYTRDGRKTYVLDYVNDCWLEERATLDDALAALDRYRKDMNGVVAQFLKHPDITEAQQKLLQNDQFAVQNRFRSAAIGAEKIQVDTLRNFLDPDQPDFTTYRAALQATLTPEREAAFETTLRGEVKSWHEGTSGVLDDTKRVLDGGDLSPGSQKIQDAVTAAADKTYREFIAEVMPYHSTLATVQGLSKQVNVNFIEGGAQKLFAWVAGAKSTYAQSMQANASDWSRMPGVLDALTAGNPGAAREIVIGMHPYAAASNAALDPTQLTDAQRSDAAFKAIAGNVSLVDKTNSWIKVGVTVAEYAVATAVGGGVIRAGLAFGAELMEGAGAIGTSLVRAGQGIRGLSSALMGTGKLVKWGGFAGKEFFRHVAANFGLIQGTGTVVRAGVIGAARAMAATAAKMVVRQTIFLSTGGVVVGAWTAGQHLIQGRASPYGSVGAAFKAGAESNIFFFGSGYMPLIMFVGLPATVFRGIPLFSRLAQTMANSGGLSGLFTNAGKYAARGLFGTGTKFFEKIGATRWAAWARSVRGNAWLATAEENSQKKIFTKGVLERVSDARPLGMPLGKPLAYGFMQADGMARFFAMNWVVGKAGSLYSYFFGRWSHERDLGQYIKGRNATSLGWQSSMWWAFLPQGSAHERSRNMDAYRSFEGGKEYETAGLLSMILGAEEGARLPFKTKPSWWKRLTDPNPRADTFEVNESVKDWARSRALVHELGGKNPEDVHFMELYRASKLKDGNDEALGLKANAELRAAAVSSMVASMVSAKNQGEVAKFLDEGAVGREIDGYRLTLDIQEELASSLLQAPALIGRSAPGGLIEKANKILARYVDSAALMDKPALELSVAVEALKSKSKGKNFEAGLADFQAQVEAATKGDMTVDQDSARKMLEGIAADVAKKHALAPASVEVLDRVVGYINATYARFNYANKVGMVHARLLRTLTALENQYGGASSREVHDLINGWRGKTEQWSRDHAGDPVADNMESGDANHFQAMIKGFAAEAKSAKLSGPEREAFQGAAAEMRGAPWVVRDDKQTNMSGWRAEQLNGLVQLLGGYALQSRSGAPASRLYQLITTGGGKTLVQFIGLLPLAEALFNRRGLDRMVYITIPALKAQAVNDFVAFKVVGTRLEFGTPEDVKANIAQGKLDGRNVASRVLLIGDEADKFLFEDPQTSLGGRSGTITRQSSAYRGLDERLAGLLGGLDQPRAERAVRISVAARRALDLASRTDGFEADVQAVRAELGKLSRARGAQAPAAEADVAAGLAALRGKLNPRDGTEIADAFKGAETALREPPVDAGFQGETVSRLRGAFKKNLAELDLFGSREGAERLMRDSLAGAVERESKLNAFGADPKFAAERAALAKQIALLERFAPADAGQRLAFLQDKIAEVSADHDAAVESARAALQPEPAAPAGLAAWRAAAKALERGMSFAMRRAARDHEAAVERYYKSRESASSLGDLISEAMLKNSKAADGSPAADALKTARLSALAEVEKNRGEAEDAELKLSAGASGLGAKVRGLAAAGSGLRSIRRDIRALIDKAQDEIVAEARAGGAGWENRVEDLVAVNREILKSYAGDENPVYAAFRAMQESMRSLAYDDRVYDAGPNDPVVAEIRHKVDGKSLWKEFIPALRMLGQAVTGREINPGGADVGLTRRHAAELLRAIRLDPGMPANVKSELLWPLVKSVLWPRGITGRGDSYVRKELMNQFAGFFEDPTGVYNNPRNGEVFTRFNGQVIPNMDIRTRRYWELKAGADLTLPYEHLEVGGAEDLINEPKANFFLFSATIEGSARKILGEAGVLVLGEVVKPKEPALFRLTASEAENYPLVRKAVDRENARNGFVTVNRSEIPRNFAPEIDAYIAGKGVSAREKVFVVDADDPEAVKALSPLARRWLLNYNRKNQKGLVTAFLSDTNALMEMRAKLIAGGTKPEEIAMIFSDVQYEKANGDAKKVESEMNLKALDAGNAKVLLIDSSYVIRGIDLNFKGARDDFDPKDEKLSFAGYNHVSMLFFGVQKNTEMQIIQGAGRTSPRRALPGVERDYVVSADIQTAQSEEAFRGMLSDPEYAALLKETGAADWTALNAHVRGSGDAALTGRYDALVEKYLRQQWGDVSAQKLSASGFSRTAAPTGRFPGVEAVVGSGQ